MEVVPQSEFTNKAYYLPHHAVLRKSGGTTKLHVVFDASSNLFPVFSLNNLLMISAREQQDLYPIKLRFRTFLVSVCADMENMVLQVKLHRYDGPYRYDGYRYVK